MRTPLVLLFFSLACATPLIGEEQFVAPHVQVTALGRATAPLQTFGAAAKRAQPGVTVTIRAGIYRETVVPARNGKEGRQITYRGAPGETVINVVSSKTTTRHIRAHPFATCLLRFT